MDEQRYRRYETELFTSAGLDPTERWVDLPTIGTRARVLEVGEGQPALFLSGGPDAGATWAYAAASTVGLRCILLDRPGTGLSEPPQPVLDAERLPMYVADLTRDVLDSLELPRVSLVGCSFGGYSALRSALTLDHRIERVVLAGCPAFVPGWRQPRFFNVLRTPVLGRLLLAAPPTRSSVRFSLKEHGHHRSLKARSIPTPMLDWVRSWQRDTETMRNDAAMITTCGTRRGGFDERLDMTPDELAAIRQPCLVLVGTDDPVGDDTVGRELAAALPSAQVVVWPSAGHLPWLDDPVGFGSLVSDFLGDAGAPLQSRAVAGSPEP